jgi:hypothetical protein
MTNIVPDDPTADLTRDFQWGAVPSLPDEAPDEGSTVFALQAQPPLGPLENLAGTTFRGNGFNTIFRPQNFALTPTPLPNTAHGPDDNILELNLTEETLEFSSPLGSIPNRGFVQGDINFNGVPYVQRVKDVTTQGRSVDIHFEPGVWLSIPETDVPVEDPTVVRMGSIPHGTTIEAQGRSFDVPGGPIIASVDITPFPIGQPTVRIPFPSQVATDTATFRIPQDLTKLIADGTITQAILDDPNILLRQRAAAQSINATTVIVINTDPTTPLLDAVIDNKLVGGGTDNIAFLRGDQTGTAPNADAARMSAIFWVETVADQITVPALQPGESVTVTGTDSAGDGLVPSFAVTATTEVAEGTIVNVTYTQVQYTQMVLLNFNTLSWPHLSVATLVPAAAVPITL